MADYDCFCQFTGHTVDFIIQRLTLWPHSKWRNKCYYDNYVFLERVYKIAVVVAARRGFRSGLVANHVRLLMNL